MDKTFGYIFSQLRNDEIAIKILNSKLVRQTRKSRNAAIFDTIVLIYIVMNNMKWDAQKEINKELRKELESLKQTKGE